MNFVRLLPVIISLILLSAHFLRSGNTAPALFPIILSLSLMFRESWIPRLIQLVLLLGSVEWIYTLVSTVQTRVAFGLPWIRMAIILGSVALFTAFSCLVFRNVKLKKRYKFVDLS